MANNRTATSQNQKLLFDFLALRWDIVVDFDIFEREVI